MFASVALWWQWGITSAVDYAGCRQACSSDSTRQPRQRLRQRVSQKGKLKAHHLAYYTTLQSCRTVVAVSLGASMANPSSLLKTGSHASLAQLPGIPPPAPSAA